jgi:hypothetical protein
MNERIKLLAEQIVCFEQDMDGSMEPNEDGQWIRVDELEKFAELIVRECASIALGTAVENPPNDLFYGYNLGVNKTAEKIKQHFGIEE